MINVLKLLREMDSSNSQTKTPIKGVESLLTISNSSELDTVAEISRLAGIRVNECGMMEIPETPHQTSNHIPASINVSADTGDEVSSMIRSLMAMAGSENSQPISSDNIEIEEPHPAELTHGSMGGDMNDLIGMIDTNSDDEEMPFNDEHSDDSEESPVSNDHRDKFGDEFGDDDEEETFGDEFGDDEDETQENIKSRPYINSPDEEIEGHDYGDKQVTPKPQGFKQRMGDNPYRPAHEAVDATALRLLKDYKSFVNESIKRK